MWQISKFYEIVGEERRMHATNSEEVFMISVLVLLVILMVLAIMGPLALGFLFWCWRKLRRKPVSFEDAFVKGYEIAYPNPKKL